MKRIVLYWVAIFTVHIFLHSTIYGQNQENQNDFPSIQEGLENLYYVDQAGLELLQTATPLDEFINEETYYIGPYDVLSIQGNGFLEFSYRAIIVNASGDITAPMIGSVSLKGKTLSEAKEIISEAFAKQVKKTTINVTLDQPRPINVYVGGNIPNPGRYVLPAGTRFDALVKGFLINKEMVTPLVDQSIEKLLEATSQRPSYSGLNFDKINAKQQSQAEIRNQKLSNISQKYDLRYIKVTPLYGDEFYVDLAAYFNSGDTQFAPFIMDGDRITLTKASSNRPKVSISGAVNNSFIGTYRDDDTFTKLLSIAGGYSLDADISEVTIIRIEEGKIVHLSLPPNEITKIQPSDQVIVKFTKETATFGSVTIEGEVELPGTFTITENETNLGELLEMSGGLSEKALPNAAYLIRNSYGNRGVNSVSAINLSLLGRSSDQFLEGFDYLEFEQALNPNRMALDLNLEPVLQNTIMQNGDRLYIPKDENTISIIGQVNIPGFYTFNSSYTIDTYLSAANGLTIAADPERIYIIKAGSRAWYPHTESRLESGDIIFVDRIPFEDISTGRNFLLNLQRLKTDRTRLILQSVTAITSIVTAYVAVRNIK